MKVFRAGTCDLHQPSGCWINICEIIFECNFRLLTCALVIAIPHIPSSSVVIILTVLSSVGVPVEQVSLLYATEWLL